MSDARQRLDALLARTPLADAAAQDALWREMARGPLGEVGALPFSAHWDAYQRVFAGRPAGAPPPPAYAPTPARVERAHATKLQRDLKLADHAALHRWTVENRDEFWGRAIQALHVPFRTPPVRIREGDDPLDPWWLPGATLNIADACFRADPEKTAVLLGREGETELRKVTYGELESLVDRVAHGFRKAGLHPGDAISLYLPMTLECVAAYLGIVRAGGVVVSIADSFAPPEVATRNRLGGAKAILTTAAFTRAGKTLDLYQKVREAGSPRAIVIGGEPQRAGDVRWEEFLGEDKPFESIPCDPATATNVLFSSGTTGDPKAIPWTHLTPMKAAMDARYHQDVHEDDVLGWPTSIGWMMGPWLIYASLVNRATMALFEGAPNSPAFPRFVERAGVTVLGVVPALVRAWRAGDTVQRGFASVKTFSSTGEASNVEDYLWLMSTAGYRAPVIEYCGGTEIGGGHLTGSVAQPQSPATFSTPALGLDIAILDESGREVEDNAMGEIFLVPPSIGLSQRLLNADHDKVYHQGTPRRGLRRHGDEVERLPGGYFRAHGRADDTMNLGGIKVSSLELERAMDAHPGVYQTAAVATLPPEGGADLLVVFVVPNPGATADRKALQRELQDVIKKELNPLYRIHDVVLVDALPRTASNKIMRRELRKQYRP